MNHDPNNDPHKLSNYREWKKKHNFVTSVEIDLLKLGVDSKIIELLYTGVVLAIENKLIFALYNDKPGQESVIVFNTANLQSVQGDTKLKFASLKQMVNAIKLILLTHHKIFIHQDELPNKIILLNQ